MTENDWYNRGLKSCMREEIRVLYKDMMSRQLERVRNMEEGQSLNQALAGDSLEDQEFTLFRPISEWSLNKNEYCDPTKGPNKPFQPVLLNKVPKNLIKASNKEESEESSSSGESDETSEDFEWYNNDA